MMAENRLGHLLLSAGLVTEADIALALAMQKETGARLGEALLKLGSVSEDLLVQTLSAQLGIPVLDGAIFAEALSASPIWEQDPALPARWLERLEAVVWRSVQPQTGEICVCAASTNPISTELADGLSRARIRNGADGRRAGLRLFLATRTQMEQLAARHSPGPELPEMAVDNGDPERLRELAEQAPVIDFVNRIFSESLNSGASDIHIEPYEHAFEVRLRIDGVLRPWGSHPRARFSAVVSRIKLMSGMDIAEQRLPQDGRQSIRFSGEALDLRVSSLPGAWGESLVLRLLRKSRSLPDLKSLGLANRQQEVFASALRHSNGIVIVTGPTGSGKSTTLYRVLNELNDGEKKIITVEDPVEYNMPGITQIQVRAEIGYSFARSLRAILRHDPDVVMVGEIRDGETAQIAAQASLTGHLVLTTLHTNSALAAIERLLDLGLEPFLIASTLRALAAQRLVRRVCPDCCVPATAPAGRRLIEEAIANGADLAPLLKEPEAWKTAIGCPACGQSGYRGRLGLFEVVAISDALQEGIARREPVHLLERRARKEGFLPLFEDGLLRARAGDTTLEEVFRVVGAGAEVLSEG